MLGSAIAPSPNEDTCNGQLALVDCQHPTANWLLSGAQLYSAACLTQGHSAALTVNEDCTSLGLSLAGNGPPTPITRAQSFMLLEPSFIETIVDDTSADEGDGTQPQPEPATAITLTGCGVSFTDKKVVLSQDLDCGSLVGDQQECAVTLDGPQAEIDCKDNTLSQEASPAAAYGDGPFFYGICLRDGAKAINCNVQQFNAGIDVRNGGEVLNSNLGSNNIGMYAAVFSEDATLTIENTDASNLGNTGLYIFVGPGVNIAELNVKGENTFNSNGYAGIDQNLNAKLEINVESGATLETCGNTGADIRGFVNEGAKVEFLGDGYYACDPNKVEFDGSGAVNVDEPNCQACL